MTDSTLSSPPRPASPPWHATAWASGLFFGFAYFLGESFSGYFATWNTAQIFFWLPAGVYLGALLCRPPRHWPAIIIGTWLGDMTFNFFGDPWSFAEMFIAHTGNTLSAVLGAWAVRRWVGVRVRLESVRELFLIILFGGILALPICATIGMLMMEAHAPSDDPLARWLNWYCTDLLGIILLVPGLIVWLNRSHVQAIASRPSRKLEAALLVSSQAVALMLSFAFRWPVQTEALYVAFPFVIWSAVRFGPRGATLTIFVTAVMAHWFNAFGLGAIGSSNLSSTQKIIEMLFSIGVFSLAGLVPAITFEALGRAERRARDSEQRRDVAVQASSAALWEWDLDHNLVWISPRFRELLGHPPEELREPPDIIWSQVHADDRATLDQAFASQEQPDADPLDFDLRYPSANGEYHWFNLRGSALRNVAGRHRLLAGSLVDVNDRKQLEARVQQADKLAVIGQLAGGVAHDFNNILAAMIMNIELLQLEHHSGETNQSLTELHRLSKRAARLTEQLLMFARRRPVKLTPLHVPAALEELAQILRRLLPENIDFSWQADDQLWVQADHAMIDQVVLNLCFNARDAMPEGGRLQLIAAAVKLPASGPASPATGTAASTAGGERSGRFAQLRIIDSGLGMSREVLAHVFEPFYTTKAPGKGTGLGLASSDGIVHQHHGWIDVDSTEGQGTTFSVYLPLIDAPTQRSSSSTSPFNPPPGRETILYVEDEAAVRDATCNVLRTLGYQVLSAENAEAARRCVAQHDGPIDLLFTDTVMPGDTDGLALGRELRRADPALRVVLTSGYSRQVAAGSHLEDEGFTFLAKPFDRKVLAETLRQALDRRLGN